MSNNKGALYDTFWDTLSKESHQQRLVYFDALGSLLVEKFHPFTALDVGCGYGYLVYALRKLGVDAQGVDVSEYALSHAASEARQHLRLINVDLEGLPFPDDTFSLVTSHHSIEHLEKPEHFIHEVKRVLKPEGVIFVETSSPPIEVPERLLHLLSIKKTSRDIHPNVHSLSWWSERFKRNGFKYIGNLDFFIKQTCVELDPPNWWVGQLLLKFGSPGKMFWRQLAPITRGTLLFQLEE